MVAVNLTRLKFQINGLMRFFEAPVDFHQKLNDLFKLYANYSLKRGKYSTDLPLTPQYQLPHPVFRQLKSDLQLHIDNNPSAAFNLADELWKDEYYEVKQTAIFILSALPPVENSEPILTRLHTWLKPDLDKALKNDVITNGMVSLQKYFPTDWEDFIFTLLSHHEEPTIALGIQALAEGAKHPNFKNLPAIYRLITPFILNPNTRHLQELGNLIAVLANLSPKETGFFLKQTLSLSENLDTSRLIRNNLSFFPQDIQTQLKNSFTK